jgi:predicted ribosomally synthesized peptide with nif11-like leader
LTGPANIVWAISQSNEGDAIMSIDRSTLDFLETLNQDTAMQEALDNAIDEGSDALRSAVEFARSRGFEVNSDGLSEAKRLLESEMNDADLDGIAGGFNPQPEPPARTSGGNLLNISKRLGIKLIRW